MHIELLLTYSKSTLLEGHTNPTQMPENCRRKKRRHASPPPRDREANGRHQHSDDETVIIEHPQTINKSLL
jgi:hypothetical protein